LVLYFLVRSGYDGFYGAFGLTPEEAGIGQAEMISYTAQTLGLLTLFIAIVAVPWLIPVEASDWRAFGCIAIVLFLIGSFASQRDQFGFGSGLLGISIFYLLRTASLYNRYDRERLEKAGKVTPRRPLLRSIVTGPVVLSLVLVMAIYFAISLQDRLSDAGNLIAEQLTSGSAPKVTWSILFIDISARPVEVVWLGAGKAPEEVQGLDEPLYLGQANGMVVMFDWKRGQTLRLPTGMIAFCTKQLREDVDAANTDPGCT
jgi:hypothetical protein